MRDPAVVVLLAMPLLFIIVLGMSLGEGFGQKPDDRLRISIVDFDQGYVESGTDKHGKPHPRITWSKIVERDLAETGGIKVEIIPTEEEAQQLVTGGKRAAVFVFGPLFSEKMARSSFLADGVNPLFRDGVKIEELDAHVLRDPTQLTAASIIEQVGQVTMLRVVLPWMIGRAFEKIGDQMGRFVQNAPGRMFPNYNLTGKTWAALTRSERASGEGAAITTYQAPTSGGMLGRGAVRYQVLVPSYTVMFAYFLVLTVGWLFVAERRQGTLKRLRAAPFATAKS